MGVQDTDCQWWSHVWGSILSLKFFKIEVIGNGISGILREIQCLIMHVLSFFFRRYDETRRNTLDVPRMNCLLIRKTSKME